MTALVVVALRPAGGHAPRARTPVAADPDIAFYGVGPAGARAPAAGPSGPASGSAPTLRERVRAQPTRLGSDPFRGLGAQEGTAVEPDSASHGSAVVAAYQVGRFVDGGALAIGFSTTKNAGKTWRSGLLPALSRAAKPAGTAEFVADPSVAYDAKHRYWLIASLAADRIATAIAISRSRDGSSWGAPLRAARGTDLDKSWIACDNWAASPNRGSCYLTFLDGSADAIVMRTSRDGGRTWSRSAVVAYGAASQQSVNGAQALIRPDGTVVVAYTAIADVPGGGRYRIAVARSTDGGASFGQEQTVGFIEPQGSFIFGMRAPQFPSGDVDAGGTVYLTWHDCPDDECQGNEVLLSSSPDGLRWSRPRALPSAPGRRDDDAFLPALAVAPGTKGAMARLAVAYYSIRCSGLPACAVDAFLASSLDGGRTWKAPQRLNPKSMRLEWLADTNLGRMVGDYVATSFAGLRPVPVLALAGPPTRARFNEAIFASRLSAR